MRSLMRLLRTFSGSGGRRSTGRGGMSRSRGMGTTTGGGIGSMIRRFLR